MEASNLELELAWLGDFLPSYLAEPGPMPGGHLVDKVHGVFWSEHFWLPPNMTWTDFEHTHIRPARPRELLWGIPVCVCIMLMRVLWIRLLSNPVGQHLRFKEARPAPPPANDVLERAFHTHCKMLPDHNVIQGLSKELNWNTRQVERWWRKRKLQGKASALDRWNDATWNVVIYTTLYLLSLYNLWDAMCYFIFDEQKSWLWEPRKCFEGFPAQDVPEAVRVLYMLQLGFYMALCIGIFTSDQHKDFREMVVHHIASFALICISWFINASRIGIIVMLVHDATTPWLMTAKVAKYMKLHRLCDILFAVFALQWFFARFFLYPFIILRSTLFEAHLEIGIDPVDLPLCYYLFNGLLCSLQIYHFFWFRHIFKMLKCLIVKGQVEKDSRSDTELESSEDECKTK